MQVFLREVAKQIFDSFSENMSDHKLVFPNRRSALYFRKYFSELVSKPSLSPEIVTINELFLSFSPKVLADPLVLLFKMYESYKLIKPESESFDEFYFWGEMIINDFDDIDKYLVDHSVIFQNLKDIRDIDARFGGLDPDVIKIIKQFWSSFDPANLTPEKDDFLAVWDILASLYSGFRASLESSGLAYEGMMMREIIESITSEDSMISNTGTQYHFVGFNALNKCEKELMKYLKNVGIASFYWDYDHLYSTEENHEAGYFIRDNIKSYGQDLEGSMRFDNLISPDQPKDKWKVYKAPSDVAQAKLIPGIISEFGELTQDPNNTAIVLADENMLMPVINSLPESVSRINVTMGYPLFQTPVYSLIHQLLSLKKNARISDNGNSFYYPDVIKLLSHQYISFKHAESCDEIKQFIKEKNLIRIGNNDLSKSEFLSYIFNPPEKPAEYNRYMVEILQSLLLDFSEEPGDNSSETAYSLQKEYLFQVIKAITTLGSVFHDSNISIGLEVYIRIVDKLLRKLIVPFTGEPLSGLQVMGILETRALDFKNLIIISVNEGVLPRGSAGNSYIPYNLRMAFGLPTIKHQDSIYAYYFYRLIQRARKVRFVYNSSASGIRTGEMSRFLLQLKYNLKFDTVFADSRFNIVPPPLVSEILKRDQLAQGILEQKYLSPERERKALSPSALNTWINCRMRFYYRYIVGLDESENVMEEVDSPMFGTILHDAMEILYSDYSGKFLSEKQIDDILKDNNELERVVEISFRKNFMRGSKGKLSGKNLIITSVLQNMLSRILHIDKKYTPLKIIELEKKHYKEIIVKVNGNEIKVLLGGIIDRVDESASLIRILDYKSGKDSLDIDSIENLTVYNTRKRNSAAFQTFVYSLIYADSKPGIKIRPSLYPIRSMYKDNFSDIFRIKKGEHKGEVYSFAAYEDDFREGLEKVISDIFNPEVDFDMTSIKENCKYCSFANLCARFELT